MALLKLASADTQDRNVAQAAAISLAVTTAREGSRRLKDLIDAKGRLSAAGIPVSALPAFRVKEVTDARTNLRRAVTRIVADSESDLTSRINGESVQKPLRTAETVANDYEKKLIAAAELRRIQLCPDGVSDPLPEIPNADQVLLLRLRRAQEELRTPIANIAPGQLLARLSQLEQYAKEWSDKRPRLDEVIDALPAAVQTFLAQAARGGAPWEMVDADVRAWLDSDDNGSAFKVVHN